MYDVCIIGGGAAGISAAVAAARKGADVIILEKNNKLAKKMYATGNGRCNLSNTYMKPDKVYFSESESVREFTTNVLGADSLCELTDFMKSIGIITYDKNGYIYPVSNQASSVVWAMTDELKRLGVHIKLKSEIQSVHIENSKAVVKLNNEIIEAASLIVATGGKSYPSLGGSDRGYDIVKELGIGMTDLRPALCPVIVEEDFNEVAGIRANATAYLYICNSSEEIAIAREAGELQFTDYGLSGIMIFNLSSRAGKLLKNGKRVMVKLDFMPQYESEQIQIYIKKIAGRTISGALNGLINDKLGSFILKRQSINRKALVKELTDNQIKLIADEIKGLKVNIKALKDYEQAQVTAGGIELSEVDAGTMRLKSMVNVYAAGEVLDIDGICGGYNLTFAILSGKKAGENAFCKGEGKYAEDKSNKASGRCSERKGVREKTAY